MGVKLTEEVLRLLESGDTVKILATVDGNGVPHAVVKDAVFPDEEGKLISLEVIESSRTNSNLVHSIWFKRKVALTLLGSDGTSYQIKGTPTHCLVTGPIFERHYRAVREKLGDVDLAAVWVIVPEEIRNETFRVRAEEEAVAHPLFLHLDRIAKK
jgi:hypothetical protein